MTHQWFVRLVGAAMTGWLLGRSVLWTEPVEWLRLPLLVCGPGLTAVLFSLPTLHLPSYAVAGLVAAVSLSLTFAITRPLLPEYGPTEFFRLNPIVAVLWSLPGVVAGIALILTHYWFHSRSAGLGGSGLRPQ